MNNNIILLGDFNSKHILWGCPPPIDSKGKRLEEKLQQHNLVILNDETPTFSKSLNVLDLIIASPSIVNSLANFRVIKKKISDHWPILVDFDSSEAKKEIKFTNRENFRKILSHTSTPTWPTSAEEIDQSIAKFTADITNSLAEATTTKKMNHKRIPLPAVVLDLIKVKKSYKEISQKITTRKSKTASTTLAILLIER
jgi:hypothetical protein